MNTSSSAATSSTSYEFTLFTPCSTVVAALLSPATATAKSTLTG